MTKIIEISYANETFHRAQKINSWTAKNIGKADIVVEKNESDIDPLFLKDNYRILSEKRGAGLWLWKPYIIMQELNKANDGDYVVYCDSGAFFCGRIKSLIDSMGNQDIWVSELPLLEYEWTKPSVFSYLGINRPDITDSCQIQASFIIIKKSEWSCHFISQWLDMCKKEELLFPLEIGEEQGRCISHREDQSLLSVLCKIYSISPHKDPTQYNRNPDIYCKFTSNLCRHDYPLDQYGVTIISHRKGNAPIKILSYNLLSAYLPIQMIRWINKKLILNKNER